VLAQEDHNAFASHTLADGLGHSRATPCDIIFLDLLLPDGNGLDVLPLLKGLPSRPEIIIITGANEPNGAELAINSGAWDYIQKTDTQERLVLSFLRALEYRQKKLERRPIRRQGIVGGSESLLYCLEQMAWAAQSMASVLILGETGTGKELFARAVHENSPRAGGEFVIVDCAALQESIMGSELFGYKKGAFTGAGTDKPGLIQKAHGGTLFLDEISELSMDMQKSFLRVLESHTYRPLGASVEMSSDFRLVSASNRELEHMVHTGAFRKDLLYRLRSFTLHLPPLRQIIPDLPALASHHLGHICRRDRLPDQVLADELLDLLAAYHWPGNVRELVRLLEVLTATAPTQRTLLPMHLPRGLRAHMLATHDAGREAEPAAATAAPATDITTWKEYSRQGRDQLELRYLRELILAGGGDIQHAMVLSGLSQARLYALLKKHGLNLSP